MYMGANAIPKPLRDFGEPATRQIIFSKKSVRLLLNFKKIKRGIYVSLITAQ